MAKTLLILFKKITLKVLFLKQRLCLLFNVFCPILFGLRLLDPEVTRVVPLDCYRIILVFLFLLGVVVSQDESEEIVDEHDVDEHDVEDDLENDADDLDDVDVGEDVAEHLGAEDLEEQTKDKEITKVSFVFRTLLTINS